MGYNKGFAPKPVNHIGFGKYNGKTFEQVYAIDPDYIRWMRDTTDPADAKNEGKYAKQNQARIKYLDALLTEGVPSVSVDTMAPRVTSSVKPSADPKVFETILKVMISIEEKLDFMAKEMKISFPMVMPSELKPDENIPEEIVEDEAPF